jgi:lipoprotein-releasing system ATP-binding protein
VTPQGVDTSPHPGSAPEPAGEPRETATGGSEVAMKLTGVEKSYPLPRGKLEVLRGVDCEVTRGTILAILGASGTGKSTLLHVAGGLDRPEAGSVRISDRDITSLDAGSLARFRSRHLGFVFQFHHLLPEFTALENTMMPGLLARQTETAVRARALHLLERVGLMDRMQHRPGELSGGEKQRVAVARALLNTPDLLLADEPSGNLDPDNAARLHELILELSRENGQTVVVATHSHKLASLASRVVVLEHGVLRPADPHELGTV